MILILIPTYGRSERAKAIMDNIMDVSPFVDVLFITEIDQRIPLQNVLYGNFGSYANAINCAYAINPQYEFYYLGADDLEWQVGWLKETMSQFTHDIGVVGTNDGDGRCHTHFMVRKSYILDHSGVIGMPNLILYPYYHYFVDTELYHTALMRNQFASAEKALVLHKQNRDHVTEKNEKMSHVDKQVYNARVPLFRGRRAI